MASDVHHRLAYGRQRDHRQLEMLPGERQPDEGHRQQLRQALGIDVPKDLLLALPYLATLVILAFGAKRVAGPESLGKPYMKG